MKIISGCQTGADRAAIDAVIAHGLDWGGSVPKGRLIENDIVPFIYDRFTELASKDYKKHTEKTS